MNDIISMINRGDLDDAKKALEAELDEYNKTGKTRDHWPEIVAACALSRDKSKEAGEIVDAISNMGGIDKYDEQELLLNSIIENDHDSVVEVIGSEMFENFPTLWAELCIQKKSWRLIIYMIRNKIMHVNFRSNAFMNAAIEEKKLDVILDLLRLGCDWRLTGLEKLFMDASLVSKNREKFKAIGQKMLELDNHYDELLSTFITDLNVAQLCYIIRREVSAELNANRIVVSSNPNISFSNIVLELLSEDKDKDKNKESEKEKE